MASPIVVAWTDTSNATYSCHEEANPSFGSFINVEKARSIARHITESWSRSVPLAEWGLAGHSRRPQVLTVAGTDDDGVVCRR